MKATDVKSKKSYYFLDKRIPFGASSSCKLYQEFSNSLKHLVEKLWMGSTPLLVTNYLDYYLFISDSVGSCNAMVRHFINICKIINCPVSVAKTEWAATHVVFLGLILDGVTRSVIVPEDKRLKALNTIDILCEKRTITVLQMQSLTGILNFLNRAIVPGRAFIRLMYKKLKTTDSTGRELKHFHYITVDRAFREDCRTWKLFLHNTANQVIRRLFIDMDMVRNSKTLDFYTDSSGNPNLGFGCVFGSKYTWRQWEAKFLKKHKPSIQYLELYALLIGLMTWRDDPRLRNSRIAIFCDNKSVRDMVNQYSSDCDNCLHLIRILVLENMLLNRRVTVKYVESKKNSRADTLSRLDFPSFFRLSPASEKLDPSPLPMEIWPMSKLWQRVK